MKFKTRKDPFLSILIISLCLLLGGSTITIFIDEGFTRGTILFSIITLLLITFVIGMYNTSYTLSNGYLTYRSSILSGKIEIKRIREIVKGKTMYVGFKPAAATKGLIIKYDKYEEIYISPKTNDSFIEAILKIKNDITITEP